MTTAELKALLESFPPVKRDLMRKRGELVPIPARQYEPETVSIACQHCGTAFRIIRYQEGRPWVDKHEAECATRSAKERKFYLEHRRWPAKGSKR